MRPELSAHDRGQASFGARLRLMRSVYLVFVALAIASVVAAQPSAEWTRVKTLSPGTEVRVSVVKSKTVVGRLQTVSDNSLSINTGGGSVSLESSRILRVSVRTKARRARSVWIGLAIGAGGGAALGGAAASVCAKGICRGHGAALVAGGTGGGAAIGALIGAAVAHEGWREVFRK